MAPSCKQRQMQAELNSCRSSHASGSARKIELRFRGLGRRRACDCCSKRLRAGSVAISSMLPALGSNRQSAAERCATQGASRSMALRTPRHRLPWTQGPTRRGASSAKTLLHSLRPRRDLVQSPMRSQPQASSALRLAPSTLLRSRALAHWGSAPQSGTRK